MKVNYGIGRPAKGPPVKKVVAIGVFDGVHRGHQAILKQVVREARRSNLLSAVVTFRRHPSSIFHPNRQVPALTSLEHKLSFLEKEGIDVSYVIDFNRSFASIPAERFIKKILIEKIGMVSLYSGEDFVFGRGGEGDTKLLRRLSAELRFGLHITKPVRSKGQVVSSTLIRQLIGRGCLGRAGFLLGRRVCFLGEVVKGEGRGKSLGFPTANIKPHHEVLAPDGIYATQSVCAGRVFKSLTYLGRKPTFNKTSGRRSIEVFLFDFRGNIYGQTIEVRFIKKIRSDRYFSTKEALVLRMKQDMAQAEKILLKDLTAGVRCDRYNR